MRCGRIFNKHFAANLLENLAVKYFFVKICRELTEELPPWVWCLPFLEHSVYVGCSWSWRAVRTEFQICCRCDRWSSAVSTRLSAISGCPSTTSPCRRSCCSAEYRTTPLTSSASVSRRLSYDHSTVIRPHRRHDAVHRSRRRTFRGLCVGIAGERCKTAEPIDASFTGTDLRGSKEPCVRWECTSALPGEYDWAIHARRWRGLMLYYFYHLLVLQNSLEITQLNVFV